MRKRRAIIIDDEQTIVTFFKYIFSARGYEVITATEPVVCPIYAENAGDCSREHACADVIITDYQMPRMNGLDLLKAQTARGCKLTPKNKALMSGFLDYDKIDAVKILGCAFFDKPVDLNELEAWLAGCEQRMDLSVPLAERRREARIPAPEPASYEARCADDTLKCGVINVSPSGFCLEFPIALDREQLVHITAQPLSVPRAALVRWVSRQDDGSYLAGLSCY
jgi:DNA-binding response OmpR family regulator